MRDAGFNPRDRIDEATPRRARERALGLALIAAHGVGAAAALAALGRGLGWAAVAAGALLLAGGASLHALHVLTHPAAPFLGRRRLGLAPTPEGRAAVAPPCGAARLGGADRVEEVGAARAQELRRAAGVRRAHRTAAALALGALYLAGAPAPWAPLLLGSALFLLGLSGAAVYFLTVPYVPFLVRRSLRKHGLVA